MEKISNKRLEKVLKLLGNKVDNSNIVGRAISYGDESFTRSSLALRIPEVSDTQHCNMAVNVNNVLYGEFGNESIGRIKFKYSPSREMLFVRYTIETEKIEVESPTIKSKKEKKTGGCAPGFSFYT